MKHLAIDCEVQLLFEFWGHPIKIAYKYFRFLLRKLVQEWNWASSAHCTYFSHFLFAFLKLFTFKQGSCAAARQARHEGPSHANQEHEGPSHANQDSQANQEEPAAEGKWGKVPSLSFIWRYIFLFGWWIKTGLIQLSANFWTDYEYF